MSDLHELAGMVNVGFRLDEIDDYLNNVVHPKMKWRPSMVVDHNTGSNPHWTKDTTIAQSVQLVRNMSVTWASPPNDWTAGPHWVLGPNLIAVAAWPMWLPGIHSPSWNHVAIGTEHSGDFDKEPLPDDYRAFALAFNKKLFKFISKMANEETYKHHYQDPHTTHHHCTGLSFGPTSWWIDAINTPSPAEKLLDLPHIDLTAKKPVPAMADPFIQTREGDVLHSYPDASGFAEGYGTQIKPDGTRVQAGETITQAQAEAWQSARTAADWDKVQGMLTRPISDGLATAILSFCYEFNTVKFDASSFKARINEGNLQAAADSLYQWHNVTVNGKLTPSDGIKKRRKMEIALFLPGWVAPEDRKAPPVAPVAVKLAPSLTTKPLIGVPLMATAITTASVKNTLNTISLSGAFTIIGASIPLLFSTFGTYGLAAAGILFVCLLIQAFLPVGTAQAIEAGALTAIPVAEQLLPQFKAMLEEFADGIRAAQAAPGTTTTVVASSKTS